MKFIKLAISILPWFLCVQGINSQQKTDEFGSVTMEQLTMKSYSPDDKAEAVVLHDIGTNTFYELNGSFRMLFTRTTRIKILSKAGLDFAAVEIPYYMENNEMEDVFYIEGYTYNLENGAIKKTKLDNKSIFEERVSNNIFVKKFALPDAKEGSVVEFKYKLMSPFFFNLHDWEFQSKIPTVYSEYTVNMIPFYEYSYIMHGAKKFDVYRNTQSNLTRNFSGIEYPDNIFTFGMKNVPAFRDEEYITSVNDYLMKLDFQLAVVHHTNGADIDVITTWPLLIQELQKHSDFGGYMKAAERNAEEIIAGLPLNGESLTRKTEIIASYVSRNFNWDGSKSKFCSQTVKDFMKKKTGNSADINLFLCSLLKSAGIQCYPLILSTRDHGKVYVDYPFQQFLNYAIVIAYPENEPLLIDATESLCPLGLLPARCINEKGLVVCRDKTEWIALKAVTDSKESDSIHIALNENLDSVLMEVEMATTGHRALDYRRFYLTDAHNFSKRFINSEMTLTNSLEVHNTTEIGQPFIVKYAVNVPIETIGDKLLISPFAGLTFEENPLKAGFRNYPVDMIYPLTKKFYSIIEIPKGYKFAEQNKNVEVDNSLVRISYSTEIISDKLCVKGTYSFKNAVYLPSDYFSLKGYFSEIVETFNDKIVLIKL